MAIEVEFCPECGSRRISEIQQVTLLKEYDASTGKLLNPDTHKSEFPLKKQAEHYREAADTQCFNYQCRKCGWTSELFPS